VRARPVAEVDFARFGTHTRLTANGADVVRAAGDGWRDVSTPRPPLRAPAHIGMTTASALPHIVRRMERHLYTEEALLCTDAPLVLPLAPAGDAPAPSAHDVTAVLIEPGDLVVLAPGTWHDACHGVSAPARYYWLATTVAGDEPGWVELAGGPVEVIGCAP
jgi:ureidoglycolate lyase